MTTAHAILHRDLKPENVFLDVDQNVKLGDFGLSKQIAAQTFANTYVGTPYYMSPELASGQQYDIKSDIWALGCIVYELCALSPPFDAANQAELTRKIKQGVVPSLPRPYSRDLQDTVNAMLQLDHRRRPTTRQLLQIRQMKWACRMHELAQLHRKVQLEKERVESQAAQLEAREKALHQLEAELEHSTNKQQLAEHERMLEERHQELQHREETCTAMQTELSQRYEQWYHGERAQLQEALAEKDAQIAALQAQVASREETSTRRSSDPLAMAGRLPPRAGLRAPRRTSRGREADEDLRTRIAEGALSLGTPRSQKLPDVPPSDEWVDQEAEEPSAPPVSALAHLRHLEIKADLSDCSMKDASTMWRIQSAPETETASPMPSRVLAGLDTPEKSKSVAATAPENASPHFLSRDPQWHLVHEDDRPSPFLKRVTRVPLEELSKPAQEDDAYEAPQLVPGPSKPREPAPREPAHDQENVHVARRQRLSFAEQRRRRSSLLRPPDARSALSRPEASRLPAARAHPPASPAGRMGPTGRPQTMSRPSPRFPRARPSRAL
ncbi:non-specific serine/threonine protein kinase [Malassezia obtusa]|uniref:non-specific serine/threonine protein kinase n=1 Tax=Malassezia obtusa TaxID=76774 RepID=A0AAF0E402_9BASI|nr:non-specific serine/threonine protein kinase [Malassezia obtusa]